MRILLDSCVWGKSVHEIEAAGHDVEWTGDWQRDPGDSETLAYAVRASRILVTLDKDFGELPIVRGQPHCGIVRLVGFSARQQAVLCAHVLTRYGTALDASAIVTVEPGRVRVRPAD